MKSAQAVNSLALVLSLLMLSGSARADSPKPKHPFTADDLSTLRNALATAVSQDGTTVLCQIKPNWSGPSSGLFMTAWMVTQTGRYKAAIEGAGITDWASFMWTSDVQQIDYDARWPEKNIEAFLRFSPVMQVSKVTTPILILHGEADVRVPTYQGRQFFEALAANCKTIRMVSYPGSPHNPKSWEQVRNVLDEITAWLGRYNP